MSYEEEFDKIIRQKAGEADYPFDETNWQKTSRMLDAERATAKKMFWKKMFIPGAVIVAVGTASLIAFNHFTEPLNSTDLKQNNISALTSQPAVVAEEVKSANIESQPEIEKTEKTIISNENKLTNTSRKSEAKIERLENTTTTPQEEPEQNNLSNVAVLQNSAVPETNKLAAADETEESTQATPEVKSENPPIVAANDNNVSAPEKNETIRETNRAVPPVLSAAPTLESTFEELQADELYPVFSMLEPIAQEAVPTLSALTILQRYEDYFSKKAKTHYLNLEAGSTYLLGWNTAAGTDAKGFNWFGGMNYGYYICKKTSVSIGLQAYNISNITQPFYKGSEKEYGFGSSSTYTTITSNNLIFAAVPVKLTYHLNPSNQIGLGFNAAYILQADNEITTYTTENGVKGPANTKGVYDKVESTNFMGSVFYNARLSQRLGVNAEFVYGLTDIFQNTVSINNVEKPVGVRLSLQYYLFDK